MRGPQKFEKKIFLIDMTLLRKRQNFFNFLAFSQYLNFNIILPDFINFDHYVSAHFKYVLRIQLEQGPWLEQPLEL